jgi:hypothetical protein
MILVNLRKTVQTFRSSGMLNSGQYGLDTISFKVIFEFAVPTVVVLDYMRPESISIIEYRLAVPGMNSGVHRMFSHSRDPPRRFGDTGWEKDGPQVS